MKLVHKDMAHVLTFEGGYVNELVIENRRMFFEAVNSMTLQAEGGVGSFVLSVGDRPVEFYRHADLTVQFAPFCLNRKTLLSKLYGALERRALDAEHYIKTQELLGAAEKYVFQLSEDFPFEITCRRAAVGPLLRTLAPEIEEDDKSTLEKVFAYMELVRELDRDKLFIMVNMRSYFSDEEMESFTESVTLHDFKVLLLESTALKALKHTKRFFVDADLCEF